MLENTKRDDLRINGMVADVLNFVPSQNYDVVIMDRILHMFNDDSERTNVLRKVSTALNANGYVLIADIPKHKALIRDYFDNPQ